MSSFHANDSGDVDSGVNATTTSPRAASEAVKSTRSGKAKAIADKAVNSTLSAARRAGRSSRSLGAELRRFLLNGDFIDLLLAVVIG